MTDQTRLVVQQFNQPLYLVYCVNSTKNMKQIPHRQYRHIIRVVCLFIFVEKNENTHWVHAITKWWWKEVGVGEEELTRNYIELVVAPQTGQEIIPNMVMENLGILFLKLSGNLACVLTEFIVLLTSCMFVCVSNFSWIIRLVIRHS